MPGFSDLNPEIQRPKTDKRNVPGFNVSKEMFPYITFFLLAGPMKRQKKRNVPSLVGVTRAGASFANSGCAGLADAAMDHISCV